MLLASPLGECNCISLRSTCTVHFGWVNISCAKFFVSGPKFTSFFSSNVKGIVVDNAVFRFVDCLIRSRDRSKGTVVRNRAHCSVDIGIGWVNISRVSSVVSGLKFTNLFVGRRRDCG